MDKGTKTKNVRMQQWTETNIQGQSIRYTENSKNKYPLKM